MICTLITWILISVSRSLLLINVANNYWNAQYNSCLNQQECANPNLISILQVVCEFYYPKINNSWLTTMYQEIQSQQWSISEYKHTFPFNGILLQFDWIKLVSLRRPVIVMWTVIFCHLVLMNLYLEPCLTLQVADMHWWWLSNVERFLVYNHIQGHVAAQNLAVVTSNESNPIHLICKGVKQATQSACGALVEI